MTMMMNGQLPDSGEIRDLVAQHVTVLEGIAAYLEILAREGGVDASPFEFDDGGQAPGGANFTVAGFMVPIGKRVILRRCLTTAPAGSGPLAVYASPSGSVDGGSLRHIVAAPQLAATDIGANGTVVKGGLFVIFQFRAAVAGTCTVRLEGVIENEGPRSSYTV